MWTGGGALVLWLALSLLALAEGPTFEGQCHISWKAPTRNEDGSTLKDLDHYRLYIRKKNHEYVWETPTLTVKANKTQVNCPKWVRQDDGQYYVVVRAVDTAGRMSDVSNEFAFRIKDTADADETGS
jgi:hypothetical protein